jgi:ubiquinone/menaquinone biosynthesis C-methylase UbiE
MVVFNPPHLISAGPKSYMALKYGLLSKNNFKEDLKKGFSECFRVLKKDGFLIFKWNECQVSITTILKLTKYKPLFGQRGGRSLKTHWIVFKK